MGYCVPASMESLPLIDVYVQLYHYKVLVFQQLSVVLLRTHVFHPQALYDNTHCYSFVTQTLLPSKYYCTYQLERY